MGLERGYAVHPGYSTPEPAGVFSNRALPHLISPMGYFLNPGGVVMSEIGWCSNE